MTCATPLGGKQATRREASSRTSSPFDCSLPRRGRGCLRCTFNEKVSDCAEAARSPLMKGKCPRPHLERLPSGSLAWAVQSKLARVLGVRRVLPAGQSAAELKSVRRRAAQAQSQEQRCAA